MACFSLTWLEQLLIWLVIIGAVVAIVRLAVPLVVGPLGAPGTTLVAVLNVVVWAIVAIAVIILIFDLLSCLVGAPRLR